VQEAWGRPSFIVTRWLLLIQTTGQRPGSPGRCLASALSSRVVADMGWVGYDCTMFWPWVLRRTMAALGSLGSLGLLCCALGCVEPATGLGPAHLGQASPVARSTDVAPRRALSPREEPPSTRTAESSAEPEPPTEGPEPLVLSLGMDRLALPAGRARVAVELAPGSLVSVGVLGPSDALLGFDVQGEDGLGDVRASRSLDEDGRLPAVVSLVAPAAPTTLSVLVDAAAPVVLVRASADPTALAAPTPRDLKLGKALPRPLIGLPAPLDPLDGYVLEAPQRYLFLRVDVGMAVRAALRQTKTRFRRNPISVGHASQWDGAAPGMDRGKSQHIGHRGGLELDLGLPSSDDSPSVITRRCEGVLVEREVLRCAPGTVKDFDALRLGYLLGLLIDGPTPNGVYMPKGRPGPIAIVDSILTDEAYIEEIRRAADELRRRHWIHDEGYAALMEDGILRPSPWHVDHVHLRFAGELGRPLFAPEPPMDMPAPPAAPPATTMP
jgi:hypothetical protein